MSPFVSPIAQQEIRAVAPPANPSQYCSAKCGSSMAFNEMVNPDGSIRSPYARGHDWLKSLSKADIERARREAEGIFRRLGITFAVYGSDEASERLIPFDVIPRVFSAQEWRALAGRPPAAGEDLQALSPP